MRVLFVYADFRVERSSEGRVSYQPEGWYNEGLGSLSAVLEQHGHRTVLYHLLHPPEKDEFQAAVRRAQPDLVAFSLRSQVFRTAGRYVPWAKELGCTTIAGSYHPTLSPEETIALPGLDAICLGEGETPLAELCDRLEAGRDPYDIPSLWFKRGDQVIRNPVGPVVENLDDLPIPNFALFNLDNLISTQTYTALSSFTRGCPYSCTYCCNHKLRALYPNAKRWLRTRSPQNAVAYIRALRAFYPGLRYLRVMDDIFHWDNDWLEEFGRLYRAEFDMPIAVNHRPNAFSERAARLLREMGCYQIYFGVESGNEYIRSQVLRRKMTNRQIEEAFAHARREGMATTAYNMVGLPFETMERALDTIKLNARIAPSGILNPTFCPFPDTDLYAMAVKEGFCRPEVDYEENVVCSMPGYGPDKIAFVCTHFKLFVRLYKAAYRLPSFLRQGTERLVDATFLWPRMPYGILTKLGNARYGAVMRSKSLVRRYAPGLYLSLRNRTMSR